MAIGSVWPWGQRFKLQFRAPRESELCQSSYGRYLVSNTLKTGCEYVPVMRTGTIAPAPSFLKKGSRGIRISDLIPPAAFDNVARIASFPRRSIASFERL